jgi:hypothetical protein
VIFVDNHTGDTGQLRRKGVQVAAHLAVEYLDPVGARVGDVHPPPTHKDIGVIEARFVTLRDLDEAGATEAHALSPLPTSCLHQA